MEEAETRPDMTTALVHRDGCRKAEPEGDRIGALPHFASGQHCPSYEMLHNRSEPL